MSLQEDSGFYPAVRPTVFFIVVRSKMRGCPVSASGVSTEMNIREFAKSRSHFTMEKGFARRGKTVKEEAKDLCKDGFAHWH